MVFKQWVLRQDGRNMRLGNAPVPTRRTAPQNDRHKGLEVLRATIRFTGSKTRRQRPTCSKDAGVGGFLTPPLCDAPINLVLGWLAGYFLGAPEHVEPVAHDMLGGHQDTSRSLALTELTRKIFPLLDSAKRDGAESS